MYYKIGRGLYRLKEAEFIAFQKSVKNLVPEGYILIPYVPVVWKHNTRRITFTLAVNDFGIKYFSRPNLEHILHTLKKPIPSSLVLPVLTIVVWRLIGITQSNI